MKKIIRLSESDLTRIVNRIVSEETMATPPTTKVQQTGIPTTGQSKPVQQFMYKALRPCKPGESGTLVLQDNTFALSNGKPICQIKL
jgi:hypothetical protein